MSNVCEVSSKNVLESQGTKLISDSRGDERPQVHLYVFLEYYAISFNDFRLKGPTIEIVVRSTNDDLPASEQEPWSLPKALVFRSSVFLRATPDNRITLYEDNPKIFDLFVEWMYYGQYSYTVAPASNTVNLDIQAWVLGGKLQSVNFQNYAMSRLHAQYTRDIIPRPVRIVDVEYACKNSAAGSQLRQLFFEIVATHLTDVKRVEGSAEVWDRVLMDHAEARLLILKGYRMAPQQRQFVKLIGEYTVIERPQSRSGSSIGEVSQVIPAKRDAEGAARKELTDN